MNLFATKMVMVSVKQSIKQRQMGEMVRRHYSYVLQQEGRNIYGHQALVTVTRVLMSPDMGIAKIFLSIFNVENKEDTLIQLEREGGRLKQSFARRIRNHVRRIPQIDLYIDNTLDTMDHLNTVFNKLHVDNQMGNEEE